MPLFLKSWIEKFKKLNLLVNEFIIFNIADDKIKIIFWQNKKILKKIYPLESDTIANGFLINVESFQKILNQIKNDFSLSSTKIIKTFINLETTDFYVLPVSFFEVPKENINEIIKLNIKNLIPFNINDVYFNYKIYGYDEETKKRNVSVFVIKKKLIDEYVQILNNNNFLTLFIGIDAFNLADLLITKILLDYNQNYLFIFAKEESLTLIFIKNIQIKVIWSENFKNNSPENIINSFQKHLTIIEKTEPDIIFFFGPENEKNNYQQIFQKIWPKKELKIPESSFEEWFIAEELINQAVKFPSLKFMSFLPILPEKEYIILRIKEQARFWILTSIALLLVLNLSFYLAKKYGDDLLDKLQKQRLIISSSILEKYSAYQKEVKEFNSLLAKIKKEHQPFPYYPHLNFLLKIPQDIKITEAHFESHKIILKASASNLDSFNLFKKFLQQNPEVESFDIPLSKIEYINNINFEVTINLKIIKN